jgi:hypothetical protein
MRCYFMRGGDIASAEELTGLSDEDATDKLISYFLTAGTASTVSTVSNYGTALAW